MIRKLTICFLLFCLSGCATTKNIGQRTKILQVQQTYKQGHYEKTIALLENILAEGHSLPYSKEARLLLAKAYYHIKDYYNAVLCFGTYLETYPEGPERKEAYEFLDKINLILKSDKYVAGREASGLPGAGRQAEGLPLPARVIIEREHSYTLSPPFLGEDSTSSYFVVTGIAFNEGGATAKSLCLEVTLFNFYENVLDVSYITLGDLEAGEKRAFSVKFPHFKNISVNRYEIKPIWKDK